MVPGARIELATPAFSGRRSTNELPRRSYEFSILETEQPGVKPAAFAPYTGLNILVPRTFRRAALPAFLG